MPFLGYIVVAFLAVGTLAFAAASTIEPIPNFAGDARVIGANGTVAGADTTRRADFVPFSVSTFAPSNIDGDMATVWGEIDVPRGETAEVWFEFGRNTLMVNRTESIIITPQDSDSFKYVLTDLNLDDEYFYRAVATYSGGKATGEILSFRSDTTIGRGSSRMANQPRVETDSAKFVEDDSAQLRGEVEMFELGTGLAYFVYGNEEDEVVDARRVAEKSDLRPSGDRLRVITADRSVRGEEILTKDIFRLPKRQTIYFTLCVEYDKASATDVVCGGIESFETKDDNRSNNGQEPNAITIGAREVSDSRATIQGDVQMNDFEDGIVFFVYGEDEEEISEVVNFSSFAAVDEDDEDILKERVDRDLDTARTYDLELTALEDSQDYFYRICVEFENDSGDETLECGNVRDFETDED